MNGALEMGRGIARGAAAVLAAVLLTACGTASSPTASVTASPSPHRSPSVFPSASVTSSPTQSQAGLPSGWKWYLDVERGYRVGVAAEWTRRADSTVACPNFSTNTSAPNARLFRPTDEAFLPCAVPASGCTTPPDNGPYTPITVSGVKTYESLYTGDGQDWPKGLRQYSVYLPGNGICYELHVQFMAQVSDGRVSFVRQGLWTTFTVFPPGTTPASSVR